MSRLRPPLLLVLLLSMGGCATLQSAPPADRDAALRMDRGLAALGAGRTEAAFEELAWVVAHCTGREAGAHARLALAALELDPRNDTGRPAVGTALLGELILDPRTPPPLIPMAETAYLLALGLGARPAPEVGPAADTTAVPAAPGDPAAPDPEAAEPVPGAPPPAPVQALAAGRADAPVYGCGPMLEADPARVADLPTLPGPSLAAMLARERAARETEAARATGLSGELDALRQELTATRAELDRIRRTLRP
jgi:hypothetical protein